MAILRRDDWLSTPQGQALAGAQVYYLTQPADTTDSPPSPLATVYSNLTGTPAENPLETDGYGHVVAYLANTQLYTLMFVHPLLGEPLILKDQSITGGSGNASFTPFGVVPTGAINGTNVTFTLPFTPTLLFLTFNIGTLQPNVGYTTAIVAGVFTITLANAPGEGDTLYAQGII